MEEIRQFWAEGETWIIKREEDQYWYRVDQKPGPWKSGLPPGVFPSDAEILFDD